MLVELLDVPADDVRHLRAAGLQVVRAKRFADPANVLEEAALGEQGDHKRELQQPAKGHMPREPRRRSAERG